MNILMMTSAAPDYAPFSTSEKRPPLGLGFLISVLKQHGHNVHFVDNYLKPSHILDTDFLVRNRIEWVGIYANTICYQNMLTMLHKLQALRDKKIWPGKIMVGGPHTSVGLETIPDFVDHVVLGEGEVSILKIVSETARNIRGEKVQDLDTLPYPAWEEFIHRPYDWTSPWADNSPVYTFNTSRGCPFQCSFCSVSAIWGSTYRYMSAERVLDDLENMIRHYGLRVAYFREDHFTLNKKRTVEFCEGILHRDLEIDWICESRVDNFEDPKFVELLALSGCKALYIGVESGSPRILEFIRKGETVDQFIRAFDLIKKFGIKTYASFVVGVPTETEEDLRLTHELIQRIQPDFSSKNIYVGLPGSELYDYVRKHELYEYEDPSGILYLKGHDRQVDRFYEGNPCYKIPYPRRMKWRGAKAKFRQGLGWQWSKLRTLCRLPVCHRRPEL
jgi:radical SAM superfamily enzyme YgiQ (UPF0313 family)